MLPARRSYSLYFNSLTIYLNPCPKSPCNTNSRVGVRTRGISFQNRNAICKRSCYNSPLSITLGCGSLLDTTTINECKIAINILHHLPEWNLPRSSRLRLVQAGIGIRSPLKKAVQTTVPTGLTHTECNQTALWSVFI